MGRDFELLVTLTPPLFYNAFLNVFTSVEIQIAGLINSEMDLDRHLY